MIDGLGGFFVVRKTLEKEEACSENVCLRDIPRENYNEDREDKDR